ncbi:MAG: hypothetical protein A2161_22560 [Candidatus Schekmanbacteria bacterium RBG_13_48_7]|uniref:Sialidase domain-containing protein n=1 Tax=Candidatus Schekmanbacteria bacterium RBG_13_48_7 TaxID=1817878 RepID=A0A1F7RSH7_9BACT|nr:MAG: hypothetical protein A2161_22560 [Candidatus Schekmanbacteria bacterium RBG_13_48_7]
MIDGVSGVFEDKELIACDRTGSSFRNNLYVVWARFYSMNIMLCRSTDNGSTWSSPIRVDDSGCYQWPVCAVGSNGEVYVSWVNYSGIAFDRSSDGGSTFGADILVSRTGVFGSLNGGIDVFSYPAIDVDISSGPHRGSIYMAFMDWATFDTDIYFTKSSDRGNSWSSPVRINDDPVGNHCDQFHPWLFVDNNGEITVIWLDRRNDPANMLMDCYMTRSTDGGLTWCPNKRLTSVSSNPTAGSKAGLLGEYIGLSGTAGRVNPLWTDTREGNQDAYTSVINLDASDIKIFCKIGYALLIFIISLSCTVAILKI